MKNNDERVSNEEISGKDVKNAKCDDSKEIVRSELPQIHTSHDIMSEEKNEDDEDTISKVLKNYAGIKFEKAKEKKSDSPEKSDVGIAIPSQKLFTKSLYLPVENKFEDWYKDRYDLSENKFAYDSPKDKSKSDSNVTTGYSLQDVVQSKKTGVNFCLLYDNRRNANLAFDPGPHPEIGQTGQDQINASHEPIPGDDAAA